VCGAAAWGDGPWGGEDDRVVGVEGQLIVLLPIGVETGWDETDHAKLAAVGEKTGADVAWGSKAAENKCYIVAISFLLFWALHLGKTKIVGIWKQNDEENIYT